MFIRHFKRFYFVNKEEIIILYLLIVDCNYKPKGINL